MSDDEEEITGEASESARFTQEQRIVAAVWVHEKDFNRQTWKDIKSNFWARFSAAPPNRSTLLNWERKLFTSGNVEDKDKCGRPLSRLMHVPYVKQSLKENPELSLRERSKILGLPRTTLLKIIRDDLGMEFEVEDETSTTLKRRHAPYGAGKWKKKGDNDVEAGGPQAVEAVVECIPEISVSPVAETYEGQQMPKFEASPSPSSRGPGKFEPSFVMDDKPTLPLQFQLPVSVSGNIISNNNCDFKPQC